MEREPDGPTSAKYSLPTIGGIFARSDHDQFLTSNRDSGFDSYFPSVVRGKTRCLYETGIDALAAILSDRANSQGPIRLWTAENFCRESLGRLSIKLDHRVEFQSYGSLDNLRAMSCDDVVLYLHFNRYEPASRSTIEAIQRQTSATVIEDFVQAPLDIARFSGDFAINSLRKFSSLDVAVAYHNFPQPRTLGETRYRTLRKETELVKSEFLRNPSDELEQKFLRLGRDSDDALAVREIASAHPIEEERAWTFDFKRAQERRRVNYATLAARIGDQLPKIKVLPGDYMYLMIETPHRDRYRADLFANRIFPVIHWADSGCERAKSLLSFHIDQRYSPTDMDRVAAVLAIRQRRDPDGCE